MQLDSKVTAESSKVGLIISAILVILLVGSVYISQLIFQEISESFAIDVLDARFVFSLSCFFYAISFFIYGPLSDSLSTKALIIFGCLGTTICLCVSGLIHSYYLYLTVMSLIGFFAASVPAALFAYTAKNTPNDKLPQAMGFMISASIIGIIFSRSTVAMMTDFWTWQTAFIIYALLIVCACLCVPFGLKKDTVSHNDLTGSIKNTYITAARLLLDKMVVIFLVIGFLLFFVYLGLSSLLTFYLKGEPFNLSSTALGWLNFAGMSAVIGATISGRFSKFFNKRIILIIFLFGVSFSVAIIGYSPYLFSIFLGIFALFLFVFGIQPIVISILNQLVPNNSRGAISSLYLLACLAGGSVGTYLLGISWQYMHWHGSVMICILVTFINIGLILRYKKAITN